jgi:hypothetical protein
VKRSPIAPPDGSGCPGCGGPLKRVHRHALDRFVSAFRPMYRRRCFNPRCAWVGLVVCEPRPRPVDLSPAWRGRVLWMLGGVGLTLAAVVAVRVAVDLRAGGRAQATAGTTGASAKGPLPGLHDDGVELPSADDRVGNNATPLQLRSSCLWGVPGRTPYRGTVEQALTAARLPPDVVRRIADMARAGTSDRVEITRTGIRSTDGQRTFPAHIPAMGFGNTLCFDTVVNFKPGHVEYAALYETEDQAGRTYSVMVPFVCGNVSVLGARGDLGSPDGGPGIPDGGSGIPDGGQGSPNGGPGSPDAGPGNPNGGPGSPKVGQGSPNGGPGSKNGSRPVPEPASWLLVATALGAMSWLRRRAAKGRS